MEPRIALLLGLSCAFAFLNGANDSGTMAASVVSSRCLTPRAAAVVAALAAFAGAMALGSAVARTLGGGILRLELVPATGRAFVACAGAAGVALGWCVASWRLRLPTSYTHALLGGWLGAFASLAGLRVVVWAKAGVVLAAVLLAPAVGLIAAWNAFELLRHLAANLSRHTLPLVRLAERLAFFALSLVHGANAAQGSMALLVLGAVLLGGRPAREGLSIPLWARLFCAASFSLGVLLGFTRTLKTLGFRIFRVEAVHSLCALGVSSCLIFACTLAGLPLSAGQINSSALLGTGAGHNPRAVRWGVAADLLTNWVFTFPATACLSYLLIKVVR